MTAAPAKRLAAWLLALVAGVVSPVSPAAEKDDLQALRQRLEQLRAEIAGAEETRAEARDSLRESEQAISEANRELRGLARQREAARAERGAIAEQQAALEKVLALRSAQLGRLLAARYLHGEAGYARLLLAGTDPQKAARDTLYLGYLSRAEADFIRAMRSQIAGLEDLEQRARAKGAEIAAIEAGQAKERERLLAQSAARKRVLARVSAQIRENRRQVKVLERDESRLARLIEEIAKVIAAVPQGPRNERVPELGAAESVFEKLKGRLRLPIRGELTNRFGTPRSGGGPAWKGLFIRSPPGQEVRAVAAGRVVFAEWMRGFGNLLIIDHGRGYLSIYGNNESVLKSVGEDIRTGDAVATVGSSGGSAESGLYFEIRHEGKAFDPLKWVSLK